MSYLLRLFVAWASVACGAVGTGEASVGVAVGLGLAGAGRLAAAIILVGEGISMVVGEGIARLAASMVEGEGMEASVPSTRPSPGGLLGCVGEGVGAGVGEGGAVSLTCAQVTTLGVTVDAAGEEGICGVAAGCVAASLTGAADAALVADATEVEGVAEAGLKAPGHPSSTHMIWNSPSWSGGTGNTASFSHDMVWSLHLYRPQFLKISSFCTLPQLLCSRRKNPSRMTLQMNFWLVPPSETLERSEK